MGSGLKCEVTDERASLLRQANFGHFTLQT
jgi:hypothetical protein